ncbi:hypothetical protein [Candidatus Nitrosocosmicus hydrocola]|nr:hypothetical protein [Candidatus Nitrosocosmicus hydrocola]
MVVVTITLASGKIGLHSFATSRTHIDLPAKEYKEGETANEGPFCHYR